MEISIQKTFARLVWWNICHTKWQSYFRATPNTGAHLTWLHSLHIDDVYQK